MRVRLLAGLVLALACAPALAQSRLTGTVKDSSGAVVPGASVVAKNVETGQATSAQTSASGVYTISLLNPGRYEVSCELSGFKRFTRAGIVLETGTTTTIDITLDVGQLTEVVSVTASAPLLESESGSVGQLIENQMILNMPIQSRRVGVMVRMMGNVSFTGETGGQSIPGSRWRAGGPTTRCGISMAGWSRTRRAGVRSSRSIPRTRACRNSR